MAFSALPLLGERAGVRANQPFPLTFAEDLKTLSKFLLPKTGCDISLR
jgi:hypothetical protein